MVGVLSTDCASSHVTIGDRPILYIRVKKASAVKIIGAIKNSYSSNIERTEVLVYGHRQHVRSLCPVKFLPHLLQLLVIWFR